MVHIAVSNQLTDLINSKIRLLQQLSGPIYSVIREVFLVGRPCFLFEQLTEIIGIDVKALRNIVQRNVLVVVLPDILLCFQNNILFLGDIVLQHDLVHAANHVQNPVLQLFHRPEFLDALKREQIFAKIFVHPQLGSRNVMQTDQHDVQAQLLQLRKRQGILRHNASQNPPDCNTKPFLVQAVHTLF